MIVLNKAILAFVLILLLGNVACSVSEHEQGEIIASRLTATDTVSSIINNTEVSSTPTPIKSATSQSEVTATVTTSRPTGTPTAEISIPTVEKTKGLIEATSTKRSTRTPSPTLLPTMAPDLAAAIITDKLNDPECRLPCYMGFHPSESAVQDVVKILKPLATYSNFRKTSQGEAFLFISQNSPLVRYGLTYMQSYYFKSGTLETVEAIVPEDGTFDISAIFNEYGMPDDVWLTTRDYSKFPDVSSPMFALYLYYPDNGFFVYQVLKGQRGSNSVTACTDNYLFGHIAIWQPNNWDPENIKQITDRAEANREAFLRFERESWDGKLLERPLVETTEFTVKSFYEAVISSEEPVCIETSFEYWPEFSGSG